jgi:predicted metalloprotease
MEGLMAVTADSVVEGAFFRTLTNQIRAVLEVKDDKVSYVSGNSNFQHRDFKSRQWQEMKAFLAEVDEEVEETWDPNYQHPEQSLGGPPTDSES